jgi:hypothetical protein
MDFIPEKSAIQLSNIEFKDKVVYELIKELGLKQHVSQYKTDKRTR